MANKKQKMPKSVYLVNNDGNLYLYESLDKLLFYGQKKGSIVGTYELKQKGVVEVTIVNEKAKKRGRK